MQTKLRRLFDFQRFVSNSELDKMIEDAQRKSSSYIELTEDEVEFVAAGAASTEYMTEKLLKDKKETYRKGN